MKAKPQVLVIDDDAVVSRSIDRVLSDRGYEVDTALSGEEGLKDIENHDYDVVFTDIKMPGMDGIEVARRIRDKYPLTPVVVITGYGTTENEAQASVLGVSGFVRKPLTPELIENITHKALEKPVLEVQAANEPAAPSAVPETSSGLAKAGRVAKNIALFLAAPFIALGYVIALPAVGFYMFARFALEALRKRRSAS
ncbi:MAG: response regulator [Xanthomonadales bacterium]|nr:response regulator [Xanthomonadales bacterium]